MSHSKMMLPNEAFKSKCLKCKLFAEETLCPVLVAAFDNLERPQAYMTTLFRIGYNWDMFAFSVSSAPCSTLALYLIVWPTLVGLFLHIVELIVIVFPRELGTLREQLTETQQQLADASAVVASMKDQLIKVETENSALIAQAEESEKRVQSAIGYAERIDKFNFQLLDEASEADTFISDLEERNRQLEVGLDAANALVVAKDDLLQRLNEMFMLNMGQMTDEKVDLRAQIERLQLRERELELEVQEAEAKCEHYGEEIDRLLLEAADTDAKLYEYEYDCDSSDVTLEELYIKENSMSSDDDEPVALEGEDLDSVRADSDIADDVVMNEEDITLDMIALSFVESSPMILSQSRDYAWTLVRQYVYEINEVFSENHDA